jgi:hypothetical protein
MVSKQLEAANIINKDILSAYSPSNHFGQNPCFVFVIITPYSQLHCSISNLASKHHTQKDAVCTQKMLYVQRPQICFCNNYLISLTPSSISNLGLQTPPQKYAVFFLPIKPLCTNTPALNVSYRPWGSEHH